MGDRPRGKPVFFFYFLPRGGPSSNWPSCFRVVRSGPGERYISFQPNSPPVGISAPTPGSSNHARAMRHDACPRPGLSSAPVRASPTPSSSTVLLIHLPPLFSLLLPILLSLVPSFVSVFSLPSLANAIDVLRGHWRIMHNNGDMQLKHEHASESGDIADGGGNFWNAAIIPSASISRRIEFPGKICARLLRRFVFFFSLFLPRSSYLNVPCYFLSRSSA